MSLMGRDMRRNRAPGCYLPVYDWSKITSPNDSNYNCVEYVFFGSSTPINATFQNIYFPVQTLNTNYDPNNPNSKQYTTTYENAGVGLNDIIKDYISLYGERPFTHLYYFDESNPNSVEGNKESLNRLRGKLAAILDQNKYKYKRLAETLGFVYDPINNYDMVEQGTDTKTLAGSEELEHEVDPTKLSYIEASGPITGIGASQETLDISFVPDKVVHTYQKGVSDVRAGMHVSTNSSGAASSTIGVSDGETPTTKHYTTTMDNDEEGRLENYDETAGDTSQMSNSDTQVDFPLTGRKTAGSPNAASYTDTKSFTDRTDTNDHELTRKGNIGVTTSQQMIESERQLVRYSLLKEFFEDINRELLLSTWG